MDVKTALIVFNIFIGVIMFFMGIIITRTNNRLKEQHDDFSAERTATETKFVTIHSKIDEVKEKMKDYMPEDRVVSFVDRTVEPLKDNLNGLNIKVDKVFEVTSQISSDQRVSNTMLKSFIEDQKE